MARRLPIHGIIGLLLVAVAWPLNWLLPGLRTHVLFAPLWLGYCLIVDAATLVLRGSSLLSRSPRRYLGLFIVSAPAWWLFEAINLRTSNWVYLGREQFSALEYFAMATLSFSTVIPAVFGTAELVRGYGRIDAMRRGPVVRRPRSRITMFLIGWGMLALLLVWPRFFFPFVWISVWFILEPINGWLGYRELLRPLREGDWRPLISLAVGSLICGFFWELWNYWAYPKWVYEVPFVDFARVFEMPVLGYAGYVPFAFELFALYHLVVGLAGDPARDYLRL